MFMYFYGCFQTKQVEAEKGVWGVISLRKDVGLFLSYNPFHILYCKRMGPHVPRIY